MPGTAYEIICRSLKSNPSFASYLSGNLDSKQFFNDLNLDSDILLKDEFNEDMLNLAARMPRDTEAYVDDLLADLLSKGIVGTNKYNKDLYSKTERFINENFIHRDRQTYIFPEEARLIFALADILKPRKVAYMGSYYAYWAIWTLPVMAAGSKIWLMDIDDASHQLAAENIEKLGLGKSVDIIHINHDAIESIKSINDLDWIVLDAEGPKIGPSDEDMIDKAIYYPMIREGFKSLRPSGLMIAHNILLQNTTDSKYISEKIVWNERMFGKFLPFVNQHFSNFVHYESTEGVGVAKK